MIQLESTSPAILLIANGLDIGHTVGGAEIFCAELALALAQMGWRCTLGLLAWNDGVVEQSWENRLVEAGIRVLHPPTGQKRSFFFSLSQFQNICRAERIPLVHSHCQIGSLIAVSLRCSGQVRLALRTVHAAQEWGNGRLAWGLRQVFSKGVFGLTLDAQVCVSQDMAARLTRSPGARLGGRPVLAIPNAISEHWFTADLPGRSPDDRQGPGPVLGVVGTLVAGKGHTILIEAAARVIAEFPDLSLWIVGDGPERGELAAQARRFNIEPNVIFWGQRADVSAILAQMDLFILPSFSEGLPTVVLESMASGTPVIATDIPGCRELIEDGVTGWLVPPGDATALAARLRQVLQTPQTHRAIAENANRRVQAFRISAIARQYTRLYRDLPVQGKHLKQG